MGYELRTRLIPVAKWPDFHPWPSAAGLRWLIFHSAKNGFDAAVRRCGGRVLIDENAFFKWAEQHGRATGA